MSEVYLAYIKINSFTTEIIGIYETEFLAEIEVEERVSSLLEKNHDIVCKEKHTWHPCYWCELVEEIKTEGNLRKCLESPYTKPIDIFTYISGNEVIIEKYKVKCK